MNNESQQSGGKHKFRNRILWISGCIMLVLAGISFYLYSNLNNLLTDALLKSFNSGVISDVYELKFKRINVNVMIGSIRIHEVDISPRQKPLADYPYINSSMKLHAKKITLSNVDIYSLLKSNILILKRVEFLEPEIDLTIKGKKIVLFPIRDTTDQAEKPKEAKKSFIEAVLLEDFGLVNASIHIMNEFRQRELNVKNLSISLKDLMLKQAPGKDLISNRQVDLSMGEITWNLTRGAVKYISLSEYKLKIDSLDLQSSADTTLFTFANFSTGLKALNMHTADSLFHLTMQSFNLSYRDQSITLKGIGFKPNISDAAMQRRFTYQTPVFSGSVGTLKLVGLNFDSLIYSDKILIDEVGLDKLSVSIFKDQSKPINVNKFPKYLGQQIGSLDIPMTIRHVKGTNVNLVNAEKKPDGGTGKVNINRMTIDAKNLTSIPNGQPLSINADAWIEDKAHAFLALQFSYAAPQFSINGRVEKFNLPYINRFLKSYTPASIIKGTADEISFSANAYHTYSKGTMKFLYHDLEADLNLKDQAKWKSDLLSFVGNTVVSSSNPPSENKPAKIVTFKVDRNMNKGFINIIIKSILAGIKETIIMSKENRKEYKEAKKKARKDNKSGK